MEGEEGVSPSTDVFYICQQYSLVFVLDMTSTMIQVVRDTHSTHSDTERERERERERGDPHVTHTHTHTE